MSDPIVVLHPVMQQDVGDCGVACLVMMTGLTYAQVLAAFGVRARKAVVTEGMSRHQLMRAAKRLGCPLRFVKTDDVGRMVGIVDLRRNTPEDDPDQHLAIVANGCLYNPAEGAIWTDASAFCQTRKWDVTGIYVRKEMKPEE